MQMGKLNMLNKKPMLFVIAGPNGSGKSTITGYFEKLGVYTNADDIVKTMKMSNEEAAKLTDSMRYASIEKKEDFSFETVLSSQYKIDILIQAKKADYFIKCIFVLTNDPFINVARVETRVALGGHDVDKDKIIYRYEKSLNNIKKLIEICDILHVYDNTGDNPIRIIRKHKDDITIFPNDIWEEERIMKLLEE